MQIYDFITKTENGTIKIPEQYKDKVPSVVRVVLFEEKPWKFYQNEMSTMHKSDFLLPPTMDTLGWMFDREEANER